MWISDVLPGNVHGLAAARENVLPVLRNYTGRMPGLADCGYEGAGHGILTPVKKPKGVKQLDINARTRNMLLSSARCLGERGFALAAVTERSQNIRPGARRSPGAPAAEPQSNRDVLVINTCGAPNPVFSLGSEGWAVCLT